MKNLEYYMSLPYRMEVVPDIEEGGYMASFPELPGSLRLGCLRAFIVRYLFVQRPKESA